MGFLPVLEGSILRHVVEAAPSASRACDTVILGLGTTPGGPEPVGA